MNDEARRRKPIWWLTLAVAVGLSLALCLAFVFAQRQRPRRATVTGATNAAGGHQTIPVRAKGDFQAAINDARPGDTIVLEAGASFTGPFSLPDKGAANEYITVRTSAPEASLPSPGQRMTPAYSAQLPKLLSPGQGEAALRTAPGAHHYRFVAVEFRTTDASALVYDLVKLGDGSPAQNSLAQVPHHLSLDRCLVTAFPTQGIKRGIALNSGDTEILNCWVAGFKALGQDSQAVGGWNGPGPYKIINNYLEGAGENLLFGGATASIPNLVPSDIEVRRNHFTKPLSWKEGEPNYAGVQWAVKNLFELKNARRVVVEGNLFENNWVQAQSGFAIVFTVRGDSGAAAEVSGVDFRNNIVRHTASAFNVLGRDTILPSATGRDLRITNNLIDDVGGPRWGEGGGIFLKISEMAGTVLDHNTVLHTGNIVTAYGPVSAGFVMRNNVMAHNEYGIIGDSAGPGMNTISKYFPGGMFERNLIAGADAGRYPPGNFYPETFDAAGFVDKTHGNYRLNPASRYRRAATDGKDVGCDVDALEAAMRP